MSSIDEELQLDNNLNELYSKIDFILDCGEKEKQDTMEASVETNSNCVLLKLQQNVQDLYLGDNAHHMAPKCQNASCQKNSAKFLKALLGSAGTKSRSNKNGAGRSLVSRQKQQQLREENMWNQMRTSEHLSVGRLRTLTLYGDCQERNSVFRLLDLFYSLHEHINADLSCMPENFLPSDYLFDMPKKRTMPKTLNVRHQIFVLTNKIERFLNNQRRILETNRHFDYDKYTECDNMLNGAMSCLAPLKQFAGIEIRHRYWEFYSSTAKANAQHLEHLLLNLREWLKSAHLFVHVFNWEMDLQYRYSGAMTQGLEANNQRALHLAAAEIQAATPRQRTAEELFIAERYQLKNVVECAAEHDDFLNALLRTPEAYFPSQIVSMCEPPTTESLADLAAAILPPKCDESNQYDWLGYGDIVFEAPSSPPKRNLRGHQPWKYLG